MVSPAVLQGSETMIQGDKDEVAFLGSDKPEANNNRLKVYNRWRII